MTPLRRRHNLSNSSGSSVFGTHGKTPTAVLAGMRMHFRAYLGQRKASPRIVAPSLRMQANYRSLSGMPNHVGSPRELPLCACMPGAPWNLYTSKTKVCLHRVVVACYALGASTQLRRAGDTNDSAWCPRSSLNKSGHARRSGIDIAALLSPALQPPCRYVVLDVVPAGMMSCWVPRRLKDPATLVFGRSGGCGCFKFWGLVPG